jgi:hypothetical protein
MDVIKQVLIGSVALYLCEKGPWVLYSINTPCSLVSKAELRGGMAVVERTSTRIDRPKALLFPFFKNKLDWIYRFLFTSCNPSF